MLALYLCEMYMTGKPIPAELPRDLIPPSFRKETSRHGSAAGSRHGSVSSQGAGTGHADVDLAGMHQSKFIIDIFSRILILFLFSFIRGQTEGEL